METFVTGRDYRCLVIDGRIAAIAERVPAHVIGDGTADGRPSWSSGPTPTRAAGSGHEKVLTRIKVDQAAVDLVRAQGFGMDDVPPDGRRWSSSP